MRIVKKIAFILLLLAFQFSASAFTCFSYLKSTCYSQIQLNNFQHKTTTYFNSYGLLKMNDGNWQKVLILQHPFSFKTVSKIKKSFIEHAFLSKIASEVIDNRIFNYIELENYSTTGKPSKRRVIDFSEIENSISILPKAQSSILFFKHIKNQATHYNNGDF